MAILRTIKCDVCGEVDTEPFPNAGWMGWGGLNGVAFNGVDNPSLCPKHLAAVADFIDRLIKEA